MLAKLTKRQKKGIAFRERKHGKRQDKPLDTLEDNNVSGVEDQALVDAAKNQQGRQVSAKALVWKRNTPSGTEGKEGMVVAAEGKRKAEEEKSLGQPRPKRRRGPDGSPLVDVEEPAGEEGEKTKQRFILFLGNLKYTTTLEAIQAHFLACVPPPTVRLLTPKPSTKLPGTKSIVKSKGCAFLEFKHHRALQQGLRFHHSHLDGRQINVELTAGGGGKGVTRMKKLKERNRELEGQRRKQHDRVQPGATRCFSAPSSVQETQTHKHPRTADDVEEKVTHRGSRKHQRGPEKRRSGKDFRTGVNAIPIG